MSSADDPASPVRRRTPLDWITTSNPFYVISAGLFLFGLRISFGDPDNDLNIAALGVGLAGYTLLLAAAAILLVRFAGVWNDVRTILLLVVLLFLATSVTFDELLALDPVRGSLMNLGGLAFSLIASEGILRAIRLRLPLPYKLPYYLTLVLFFGYPILLAPDYPNPHSERLQWMFAAFPSAAALVFLMLLPAIRRGAVGNSGSPWPWPWYPWSLFAFLGVAVIGRSYLLCRSFQQPLPGHLTETMFAPFFLVPFALGLGVLLIEAGAKSRNPGAMLAAWFVPVVCFLLAGLGHRDDPAYSEFLDHFLSRTGLTPLFIALLASLGYYLYAWERGVPGAAEGITAIFTVFALAQPETLALADLSLVRPEWLAVPVAFQAVLGAIRREAWRLIVAGSVAAAWATGALWRLYLSLRTEVIGLDYLLASLLLLPVAVLVSLAKSRRTTA
jgi:hypothetical protein